jgi:hypothetical protein
VAQAGEKALVFTQFVAMPFGAEAIARALKPLNPLLLLAASRVTAKFNIGAVPAFRLTQAFTRCPTNRQPRPSATACHPITPQRDRRSRRLPLGLHHHMSPDLGGFWQPPTPRDLQAIPLDKGLIGGDSHLDCRVAASWRLGWKRNSLCHSHRAHRGVSIRDMKIHIFRSNRQPDVFGFTGDATGANLPAALGPWDQSTCGGALEAGSGAALAGIGSSGPVVAAIAQEGFFIARSEVMSQTTGKPWLN